MHEFKPLENPQSSRQSMVWRSKVGVLVVVTSFCAVILLVASGLNFSSVLKLSSHDQLLKNLDKEGRNESGFIDDFTTSVTPSSQSPLAVCPNTDDKDKFDCQPEVNGTEGRCIERGCCWAPTSQTQPSYDNPAPVNVPQCFFPANYVGYKVGSVTERGDGLDIILIRQYPSGLFRDEATLRVQVTKYNYHTARITIKSAFADRWIPPLPPVADQSTERDVGYKVVLENTQLSVYRYENNTLGTKLFSTSLSTLIFSDQFIQLSTSIPSEKVYGLGEMKGPLQHSVQWTRRILFNKDQPPRFNRALYGAHALMMNFDGKNLASGIYLKNSNAMDVILQPQPAATYRTIGGIFDFFVFIGPTPTDVFTQYQQLVGLPAMVPYWSLGYHLCRYGYWTLEETIKTYERNVKQGVPLEVQWNDIDYMERFNMFTYDKQQFAGLPDFVKRVHADNRKYVMIFDPAVSGSEKPGTYRPYDLGLEMNIFVKNVTNDVIAYKVWNEQTSIFPDFSNPQTEKYWKTMFEEFHNQIDFDGAWIDMNEPSNQRNGTKDTDTCPQTRLDFPPVEIGGERLFTYTACMSDRMNLSSHYNLHNLYPHFEARATYKALASIRSNKRPFIISRSSSPGQGLWSGHWTGDIDSTWEDMRQSIPDIINFAMYGMPMIGADICGFQYNTTLELCARWQALGAFYPFSRNHNDKYQQEQDPAKLGGDVLEATKITLQKKYLFAPYLYTLMYRAHAFGETVVRAMMFNFPSDPATHAIDNQFMWGEGLLIAPALEKGQREVNPYLPAGVWYHYNNDGAMISMSEGGFKTFPAPITDINLLLRGGNILAGQDTSVDNLSNNRKNGFILYVALDANQAAKGQLFWDDGDSLDTFEKGEYTLINFFASFNTITTNAVKSSYTAEPMELKLIHVFGVSKVPTQLLINGKVIDKISERIIYNEAAKSLQISVSEINMLDSSNSVIFY